MQFFFTGEDYISPYPISVTIEMVYSSNETCQNFTIIPDDVVEYDEIFEIAMEVNIVLYMRKSLRVYASTSRFTIFNDDSKYVSMYYTGMDK